MTIWALRMVIHKPCRSVAVADQTTKQIYWKWEFDLVHFNIHKVFQGASLVAQWKRICLQCRRCGFDPWVGKMPRRRKWQPTPVFLPGKSHGQRSLAEYSLWGHKRVGYNLVTKQQQRSLKAEVKMKGTLVLMAEKFLSE